MAQYPNYGNPNPAPYVGSVPAGEINNIHTSVFQNRVQNVNQQGQQRDDVTAEQLEEIIKEKKTYYQPREGNVLSEDETDIMKKSLKTVTEYNPQGRYTMEEMRMLHAWKQEFKKGRAVPASFPSCFTGVRPPQAVCCF
ncbi:MAG: hypothetical protein IJJ13_10355 [Lachnospiraceae bacterium]|nr:hypothetical protein [Lachnospiraceae bacterium]